MKSIPVVAVVQGRLAFPRLCAGRFRRSVHVRGLSALYLFSDGSTVREPGPALMPWSLMFCCQRSVSHCCNFIRCFGNWLKLSCNN